MKKLIITCLSVSTSIASYGGVNEYSTTSVELVGQIHVSGGTYYFQSQDSNWSSDNCPNAQYAYLEESQLGGKAMLSLALAAKSSGKPIQIGGLCGDSSGNDNYIRIQTLVYP